MRSLKVVRCNLVLGLIFAALAATPALAGSVKDRMFGHADKARVAAEEVNAKHLAPATYGDGLSAFRSAEQRFNSGKSIDSIQKKLLQAERKFEKAKLAAEIAADKLAGLIKARIDAKAVDANEFNKRNWTRAETYYSNAIGYLEAGNQRLALDKARQAVPIYRDLELVAIKAQYLNETRILLATAKKKRAHKYAPITLKKAQMLLAEAERELTENRYDADKPRGLARQAQYEAKHALYLTEFIKVARAKQTTIEQVILEWESPLQQVAAAADIVAHFEEGYKATTDDLVLYIEEGSEDVQKLEQVVSDRDQQIVFLHEDVDAIKATVAQLHERLGDKAIEQEQLAREQQRLQRRLAAQERVRQKVLELEETFTREEANVFRDSDQVYIRLVGLNFDSGSSNLKPEHHDLLQKVHDAITVFPGSLVYIEGHTDSYGGDESNLTLSEHRADSVRTYFMSNTGLTSEMMHAIGYGETKPVANNETPQGRTKNRRIDVRIVPNLDLSQS